MLAFSTSVIISAPFLGSAFSMESIHGRSQPLLFSPNIIYRLFDIEYPIEVFKDTASQHTRSKSEPMVARFEIYWDPDFSASMLGKFGPNALLMVLTGKGFPCPGYIVVTLSFNRCLRLSLIAAVSSAAR